MYFIIYIILFLVKKITNFFSPGLPDKKGILLIKKPLEEQCYFA